MNISTYLIFFFIFLMLYLTTQETDLTIIRILKKKKGNKIQMEKMLQEFIGEDCIITTLKDTRVGTLTEVSATCLLLTEKENTEIINLDYVINVKKHPQNKHGKRKFLTFG